MYVEDLSTVIWKTTQARFVAARRMRRSRDASVAVEAFLSFSIIAISLISLQKSSCADMDTISVFTIILSTFLLVLSLLFRGLDYSRRYENYHACGNELNALYRRILYEKEACPSEDLLKKGQDFLNAYLDILKKYNQNHTSFDHEYSQAMQEKGNLRKYCFMKLRYYVFDVYLLYWLIALGPIACIAWYYVMVLGCVPI